jgi:hypothetical protein
MDLQKVLSRVLKVVTKDDVVFFEFWDDVVQFSVRRDWGVWLVTQKIPGASYGPPKAVRFSASLLKGVKGKFTHAEFNFSQLMVASATSGGVVIPFAPAMVKVLTPPKTTSVVWTPEQVGVVSAVAAAAVVDPLRPGFGDVAFGDNVLLGGYEDHVAAGYVPTPQGNQHTQYLAQAFRGLLAAPMRISAVEGVLYLTQEGESRVLSKSDHRWPVEQAISVLNLSESPTTEVTYKDFSVIFVGQTKQADRRVVHIGAGGDAIYGCVEGGQPSVIGPLGTFEPGWEVAVDGNLLLGALKRFPAAKIRLSHTRTMLHFTTEYFVEALSTLI